MGEDYPVIERMPGPPRITCTPGMMSGDPCIDGTRITVAAILGRWLGGDSVEAIYEDFPHLPYGSIELAEQWAIVNGIPESVPYRRMPLAKAG
jgi:uncharacterized protein (DUF433 family)